ncbi:hypothetical protein QQP08_025945 [Theobroma cacao]|nr:hypothetical protein QQP08_024692 [Theobroma cacao]WRX33458.1 hypothetical protein QQP08_025945 [Theobroma cacao]
MSCDKEACDILNNHIGVCRMEKACFSSARLSTSGESRLQVTLSELTRSNESKRATKEKVIPDLAKNFIRAGSWLSYYMAGQYKFPNGYSPYMEVMNVLDSLDTLDTTFECINVNFLRRLFHQYTKYISKHG